MKVTSICSMLAVAGLAAGVHAQVTSEVEPNETKATATPVTTPMAAGHTLTGTSTGNSTSAGLGSLDDFRIKTTPAAAAIYRYRLVLTSQTPGNIGSILGVAQLAAAQAPWPGVSGTPIASETSINQTSSAVTSPPAFVQWYGFGRGETIFYRVTGTATTTASYTATLERTTVTPVSIAGSFQPGPIIISTWGQGHSTDTEMWVYDANLNAMVGWGDDDEADATISGVPGTTGETLQSVLRRTYVPGTYYLALSNFPIQNSQGSPCDDDYRLGQLMDFPDSLTNGNNTVGLDLQFSISDGVNAVTVPNTKVGPYDVNWFKFIVQGTTSICYPNCDQSTSLPLLNANDFQCFLNAFAGNNSYANCDQSSNIPLLNANDFQCYLNAFATGCS